MLEFNVYWHWFHIRTRLGKYGHGLTRLTDWGHGHGGTWTREEILIDI